MSEPILGLCAPLLPHTTHFAQCSVCKAKVYMCQDPGEDSSRWFCADHFPVSQPPAPRSKREKKSLPESGVWYEFTLTRLASQGPDPRRVYENAHRILESKMLKISMWTMCLEYTKQDAPHIHIMALCHAARHPDSSKLKRFNDDCIVNVKQVETLQKFESYILKSRTKPDPELLRKFGLDRDTWMSENFVSPTSITPPHAS